MAGLRRRWSRRRSKTAEEDSSSQLASGIQKPEESTPWTDEESGLRLVIENHFGERLTGANLEDEVLLRFIRGYATESDRLVVTLDRIEYLLDNLIYRYNYQAILSDAVDDDVLREQFEAWNVFIHGHDKWGHPVVYDTIVSTDLDKLETVFERNMDKIRPFRFRFFRQLQDVKLALSDRYEETIYKHTLVFDFTKFSSAHLRGGFAALIKAVISEEQHLFPETSFKTFIINSPVAFRAAWGVIKAFIDPLTVGKIAILGRDYHSKLQKFIDIDQIPPQYGGTSTAEISNDNPYF